MKKKIAIVRGKFLNTFEMQFYEPLTARYDMRAFGSLAPYHDQFSFPVTKLPSPMDLPEFPHKMPILNRLFTDAHYLYGLEEKLKGFDIVHSAETYYHYTQQALNAKRNGYVKKVIATVLENIPFNNEGIWGRRAFKSRARTELDHIVALTHKTKEALLAEGADAKKITVISHFIDTKLFTPPANVMNRRLSKKKKTFNILFSGRLEEYKGVLDICEAARILTQDTELSRYTFWFLFIGDGSKKEEIRKRFAAIRANDQFHTRLLGPAITQKSYEAMPSWYQQGDIFVAPSKAQLGRDGKPTWEEQYCTALMEAQAAGLPIVTTHSGGIPENVGDAAVMVASGDAQALAQSIKDLVMNRKMREVYAKKALDRARTVHDKMIGAKKLAQLYESLA